jgi:hypothetical protein
MKNTPLIIAALLYLSGTGHLLGQVISLGDPYLAEEGRRVIRTPDSNLLVVGYTHTAGMGREGLVIKMTPGGVAIWSKTYGGENWEEFYDVVYAGGYYYCVGYTRTWVNGTFDSPNLNADVFLVKLNLDGSLVWAKNMGRPSAGSSATDGNDLGLRIVSAAQGGVVVVARINHGASAGQGNGLIWVDPNAQVNWAFQYDWANVLSTNELSFGIWKDNNQNYVVGGQLMATIFNEGLLLKVDQAGNVLWGQRTRCIPGIINSQFTGYYNHGNGILYTADYYNRTSESIHEAVVMTNMSETGNVPTPGGVPQAVSFHYDTAGSSQNNHRSLIFPVGDGFDEFVLAVNNLSVSTPTMVTLVGVDKDLNYQWSEQIGAPDNPNQIADMVTCFETSPNLVFIGTTGTGSAKDVLVGWAPNATYSNCVIADDIDTTYLSTANTALSISVVNLNTPGCGANCWAGNDTIGNVSVNDYGMAAFAGCYASPPDTSGGGGVGELNFIEPIPCETPGCLTDLAFNFTAQPQLVYFEVTDFTGNFVYERFYGQAGKLAAGFNFDALGYKKGWYKWELSATYSDKTGVELKNGTFKVE